MSTTTIPTTLTGVYPSTRRTAGSSRRPPRDGHLLAAESGLSYSDHLVLVGLTDRPDGRMLLFELARDLGSEKEPAVPSGGSHGRAGAGHQG